MDRIDIAGKGAIELFGGVLQVWWTPGVTVEAEDVEIWVDAMHALGRGVPLPVLIGLQDVTYTTAARKVFPDAALVSRLALIGSSPVDRVVAMFRLPLLPVDFPIRYFTSAETALAWLLEPPESSVLPGTGARDVGRRPTPPDLGKGNQQGQDSDHPGKPCEEHQADCG